MVEVSNCCGARVIGSNGVTGRCSDCGEGCGVEYMPEEVEAVQNKMDMYVKPKKGSMYDLVEMILVQDEESRNDDRRLIWAVYKSMGLLTNFVVQGDVLDYNGFRNAPTPETITRARRKVQELKPELQANDQTRRNRNKRESKRGNFVFNERY